MRKNFCTLWIRNFTAACLAMVIFTTSSMIALAATPENKSLMGEITVSGQTINGNAPSVMLNGEPVMTGRTFFSAGTIATPENINSTVRIGKLGYVTLTPNTNLNLSFNENTISGTLSAGQIKVSNAEGVNVTIQTNAGLVTNESTLASNFTVNAEKAARQDDDDDADGNSALGPILVFSGIVAAAIIIVLVTRDDKDLIVSPVR
ncbi:MAG: hypothetical protein H0X72_01830 [Acidobacteria bacterium]|jgi:hypothetical protein|nr:hypothetical protein [Acidobacteriota bacterium]